MINEEVNNVWIRMFINLLVKNTNFLSLHIVLCVLIESRP